MIEEEKSNWEKYRPYIMNDMTFTLRRHGTDVHSSRNIRFLKQVQTQTILLQSL
jgi:hypothetical protein